MKVTSIKPLSPSAGSAYLPPLFSEMVQAGFPSPAQDHIEKQLDLNEHLVRHPVATFYVRVQGDSMIDAGIKSGDILIVDRSLEPANNQIIVAVLDGEFTVKRFRRRAGKIVLEPANDAYPSITVTPESGFQVWGVVTFIIHKAL